jgi:hypothetical protein
LKKNAVSNRKHRQSGSFIHKITCLLIKLVPYRIRVRWLSSNFVCLNPLPEGVRQPGLEGIFVGDRRDRYGQQVMSGKIHAQLFAWNWRLS